jgi:hypothetical protein
MTEQRENQEDEQRRAALDDFLEDHEVDSKLHDLYNHMVQPRDDTPELVKKLSDSKKQLGSTLKNTKQKFKTSTAEYSKKLADKHATRKQADELGDLLGRMQPAKKYEPPKRGVTRLNITEGFIAAKAPLLLPIDAKKSRHIKIPRMHVPKLKLQLYPLFIKVATLFTRRRRKYTIASMAALFLVFAGLHSLNTTRQKIIGKDGAQTKISKKGSGTAVAGDSVTKPEFPTLVPSSNASAIKDQIRYDPAKKVATFRDDLNGSHLLISQQQIGPAQTGDANFLSNLATNMYLKTQVDTDYGPAYLGTNLEQHIQTLAFVKGELLVFIQSQNVLDVKVWSGYVNGLKLM